jgi:signal transduction histidine kinase
MRHYRRRRREDDFITAAELACFAYCPEQWRLEYGLGLPPANRAALDAGTRHHEWKAVAERVAEEKGIMLVTYTSSPVTVTGDPSRLRQLVTNLLDNAIRFTEPGGSVTLRVDGIADRAMLRVKNTGIGIPTVHLPHIFERFYQADAARSSGGCGLGLSICRWIVQAHGGTIEADSGEVQGVEFTANLPMANLISSQPETASISASGQHVG